MTFGSASSTAMVEAPFVLDSVIATQGPDGRGGVWHSYVITQGSNQVTGVRFGSHGEVSAVLMQQVDRLNMRFAKQQSKPKR
jgi:hypothetical protein